MKKGREGTEITQESGQKNKIPERYCNVSSYGHRCATATVTNHSNELTLNNNGSDETRYHYL
jgi:hypothetical protein